jgi:Tfp pilus assembly protein PilF
MDRNSPLNDKVAAAWIAYRSGQYASAIKDFEQVLKEDKTHVDAMYGLGLVLRTNGDASGARSYWEKALEILKSRLDVLGNERSLERERVFMSSTMLQQRLSELNSK